MALQALAEDRRQRLPARRVKRNGLVQLGWPHYWLLIAILGGGLALVAMAFWVHLSSL